MTTHLKNRLTVPLIAGLTLTAIVIGVYMAIDRILSEPVEIKDVKIDTKAALKLNVLKQISKKNGITEWELNAVSATLLKDENKAVLNHVSVYFFTRENEKVNLRSNKGELNTKTHDMTFSDNVVVTYGDAILRSDKLQYIKKEHIIRSDSQVTLEKGRSVIQADSMITRLNENMTILNGHVKGKFSEQFNIR